MSAQTDTLLLVMMEHEAPDARRIQHFVKVHCFARMIGKYERLSFRDQEIVEAAAILHDIGIHPAEEKYGSCEGPLQEQEGPPLAIALLREHAWCDEAIDRVAWLVGHHHTYTNIRSLDHRILVEADFLVNLFEDGADPETCHKVYRKIFRTATGKRLFRTMFPVPD